MGQIECCVDQAVGSRSSTCSFMLYLFTYRSPDDLFETQYSFGYISLNTRIRSLFAQAYYQWMLRTYQQIIVLIAQNDLHWLFLRPCTMRNERRDFHLVTIQLSIFCDRRVHRFQITSVR